MTGNICPGFISNLLILYIFILIHFCTLFSCCCCIICMYVILGGESGHRNGETCRVKIINGKIIIIIAQTSVFCCFFFFLQKFPILLLLIAWAWDRIYLFKTKKNLQKNKKQNKKTKKKQNKISFSRWLHYISCVCVLLSF